MTPVINYIDPVKSHAEGNIPVIIKGYSFGFPQGSGVLRFGSTIADITSWTDTEIQAIIPPGTGRVIVSVTEGDFLESSPSGLYPAPLFVNADGGIFRDSDFAFFTDYITDGIFSENEFIYYGANYNQELSVIDFTPNSSIILTGVGYQNEYEQINYAPYDHIQKIGAIYYPETGEILYNPNIHEISSSIGFSGGGARIIFVPQGHTLIGCRHSDFYTAPPRAKGSYTAPRKHGSRYCFPM
jgi:hypothetical protein